GKLKPPVYFVKNVLAQETIFLEHEIRQYLQERNSEKIADLWVKGAKIDWDVLWGDVQPLRVSLPAYCFEKVRCWYTPYPDAPSVLSPLGARNKLHPFLGKNVSDLYSVKYCLDIYLDELLDYVYRLKRAKHIIPTFLIDVAFALADLAGLQDSMTLKN